MKDDKDYQYFSLKQSGIIGSFLCLSLYICIYTFCTILCKNYNLENQFNFLFLLLLLAFYSNLNLSTIFSGKYVSLFRCFVLCLLPVLWWFAIYFSVGFRWLTVWLMRSSSNVSVIVMCYTWYLRTIIAAKE